MNENMRIMIEFLGTQRTLAGADSIETPITARSRVRDALEYIIDKYPQLKLDKDTALVVVNQQLASRDQVLKADDIISFLPFISGG
jgi:molybdopterin converting factor small subunit